MTGDFLGPTDGYGESVGGGLFERTSFAKPGMQDIVDPPAVFRSARDRDPRWFNLIVTGRTEALVLHGILFVQSELRPDGFI